MKIRILMLLLIGVAIVIPCDVMAATALTEVAGPPYDFQFKAQTANVSNGNSAGTARIEFLHRDTFEIYYATITPLPAKGAWVTKYYKFPAGSGITIQNMKWIKLEMTGANSGDAWVADEILLYDSTGTLYYEMDEDDDTYEARPVIDGCRQVSTGVYYGQPMLQLLPTPALHSDETQVKIELSTGTSVCSVSSVKFLFYRESNSNAETFNAVDLNPAPLTKSATFAYITTLNQRLGNYRMYAVQNTSATSLKIEDIKLYTRHDGGVWKPYTVRDINGDGYSWSATIASSSVSIPILGASTEHEWGASLAGTNVVISNFFQGHEVWAESLGTAAAEASVYQTVQQATAGTSDNYNLVETAFYKVESSNGTAADFHTELNNAAARSYTRVRYMIDTGYMPSSGSIKKYDTSGSVLVYQVDASHEALKMHNKLVLVKNTANGPAVLYGSCNLGAGDHGRWQANTRISGIYDLWLGYDKYFANLLKYDPNTNLADIAHEHNPYNYFLGIPNNGTEFNEDMTPSTGNPGNLPWVHELGSAYDIAPITLGDLTVQSWFYPRIITDHPIATVLHDLNTWLAGDASRRAELYLMHLYFFNTDTLPNAIADELIALRSSSQADVLTGLSLNGDFTLDSQMHNPNTTAIVGLKMKYARFAPATYENHSKWIAIKKWHLDAQNNPVADSFILINGSRNMTDISLTERDENVTKIEWTASASSTVSREFEQYVYRPYSDVFKRFYNHPDLSSPVGSEIVGSCTSADDP